MAYAHRLTGIIVVGLALAIKTDHCHGAAYMPLDMIEELLDPTHYNSRRRPGDGPLDIFLNMNVNDISSISEVRMDYSVTLYLRQVWKDERLSFAGKHNSSITLNYNHFDRLWTPDVFVRNLKSGIFHDITVPNRLIRVSPDGTVLYSQRLTLTLACDMILDKYPMDNQTCVIELGSYAYTMDDLVFHWRNDAQPVEVSPSISLPEYILTGVTNRVCSRRFIGTGSFPCLRIHFHLSRRLRAYILTTYLPSFLVVLLSWLSFWIDLESAPARTSLSILTILTITTQSSALLRSTPAGSFTKAIDVWMATCLVFVFGAFIEYSIVNTLARRQKSRSAGKGFASGDATYRCTNCSPQECIPLTNGWNEEGGAGTSKNPPEMDQLAESFRAGPPRPPSSSRAAAAATTWWKDLSNNKAVKVEVISRALFPLLFLVFNAIYWPLYLL